MVKVGLSNADIRFSMFRQAVGKPWNSSIIRRRVIPGPDPVDEPSGDKTASGRCADRTGGITVVKNGTFCCQTIKIWCF